METLDPSYARARPHLTEAEAASIVRGHWDRDATARELSSERDRVFEITSATHPPTVLKISNLLEAPATLDDQVAAVEALVHGGFPFRVPAPVPTDDGATRLQVSLETGAHWARLVEHLGGVPLDRVRPHGPHVLSEIGRLVGALDRGLAGFDATSADRDMVWDLRGARALIESHLDSVAEAEGGALLRSVLARYDAFVAPRADELPRSFIHNDANPSNLRVEPGAPGSPPVLLGIVDFGDAIRSWTVADLAVACAYAGLDRADPVGVFARVARGYVSQRDVSEAEADVLFELARLRLALSVTVAAVRAGQEPDNPYLVASQAAAWRALERLAELPPELARYRLREACGHPPCPATTRVVRALRAAAPGAAPILDPDPRSTPILTIDLSIESGDDGGPFDPTDHVALRRVVFDRMRDAGVPIGIGRYDEVRWWYTGDAFRTPAPDGEEWRTIHLGIDLFAGPGTPVRAPLAGRIASVADNAERLDYGPTLIVEHELADEGGAPVRFWTLYGHLDPAMLEEARPGRAVAAGDSLGSVGAPPRNGDWAPHLHFQIIVDRLGYDGTFPGVAAPGQRDVWLALSPDPNAMLAIPGETRAPRPEPGPALLAARAARIGPSLRLSYRRPLHIVRGRGTRLFDAAGQPFLDCVNNVAHVGHAHPRVSAAACRQMGLLNTNTRYLHDAILTYAERLSALFPQPLSVCFFVCSGTEANELALRMARTRTGKVGAVVLDAAYHGNSSSVVNLSPYKFDGPGGKGTRPWVRVAPMPDAYRGRYRGDGADVGTRYAAHVAESVAALEREPTWFGDRPPGAAAFFHESLLSCGGQIPLPPGFLGAAYDAARAAGAVCVADEVQVGFGRVGTHFWAFEEHDVVPDIVTLGKPIGNGHPLGAVVTTPDIARSFDNGMEYFNTFGGNPVSCAVGLAVLDVIEEEGLRENALRAGRHLLGRLEELMMRHPAIGDVRGRGLFVGIELVEDRETRVPAPEYADGLVQRMRERGVLLSTDGPDHNVIKIKPPLVFSERDADLLASRLDEVLSETAFRR